MKKRLKSHHKSSKAGADIQHIMNIGTQPVVRNKTCKFCRSVQNSNDQPCNCRASPRAQKKSKMLRNYMESLRDSSKLNNSSNSRASIKLKSGQRTSTSRFDCSEYLPQIKDSKRVQQQKMRNLAIITNQPVGRTSIDLSCMTSNAEKVQRDSMLGNSCIDDTLNVRLSRFLHNEGSKGTSKLDPSSMCQTSLDYQRREKQRSKMNQTLDVFNDIERPFQTSTLENDMSRARKSTRLDISKNRLSSSWRPDALTSLDHMSLKEVLDRN